MLSTKPFNRIPVAYSRFILLIMILSFVTLPMVIHLETAFDWPQESLAALPERSDPHSPPDLQTSTDNIFGWLDIPITCDRIFGWTGDTLDPNLAIGVHFYDGPAGNGGVLIGAMTANGERETAVCEALGGSNCGVCPTDQPQCQHGYEWTPPDFLKDGRSHDIYAYGVNPHSGDNNILLGTPKRLTCPATTANFSAIWSTEADHNSSSLAWGDVDNDGDLDLIVGNTDDEPLQLFRNDDGVLTTSAVWTSAEADRTYSVAWGDYDNDGDLDLAVGNGDISMPTSQSHNRIYRNDDGLLTSSAVWTSPESDLTSSVAWGDVDNDGDLDLVTGNAAIGTIPIFEFDIPDGEHNRLYRNQGTDGNGNPLFDLDWSSAEKDLTTSVAWGDIDNDGDLDLAVGNADVDIVCDIFPPECSADTGERNRIYLNDNGNLQTTIAWESDESEMTSSVAWGDYDNDGDLDLAVGNMDGIFEIDFGGIDEARPVGKPNRIYRNDGGMLVKTAVWSSVEANATAGVAWGDFDSDGDLDLAVANTTTYLSDGNPEADSARNRLYRNEAFVLTETAVWESPEEEDSIGIAWADYDNDGDLDLAVANGNFDTGQPDRLYRNNSVGLVDTAVWSSPTTNNTWDVAWADYDSDGDLDLAVGNGGRNFDQVNHLYRNDSGVFTLDPAAWPATADVTTSLAWGDVDGDHDLDLVVGNFNQPNRLYHNQDGILQLDTDWTVPADPTTDVAWGDVDGDGDLDLAVGNKSGPIKLFLNNEDVLTTSPAWESDEVEQTWTIAWGDVDNDGDLDLATGSKDETEATYLYRNDGLNDGGLPQFTLQWSSLETDSTRKVAWGDYDGDGDLDLAVGNDGSPNRLYRNENGLLSQSAVWSSQEADQTESLAWGDYDGDGDLDLVAGNTDQPNRLYRNDHDELTTTAVWSSAEADGSESVAWMDVEGDGALDLIVGNDEDPLRLYRNPRWRDVPDVNDPPFVTLTRPGLTDDADFYATAEIIQGPHVVISYTLFDLEGDMVPGIIAEYSENGSGHWQSATAVLTATHTTDLTAAPWPNGVNHTFTWHAEADLIKNDNIVFRIRPLPGNDSASLISGAAQGAASVPFRVTAPWYIRVVDENSRPIAGVPIYADGQVITQTRTGIAQTNPSGLLNPGPLATGTDLIVLAPQDEADTVRPCHDGWAYRTHITNLSWPGDGSTPQYFTVSKPGEQRLVVSSANPLILFNIVVSIEWDATETYMTEMIAAAQEASRYLYDVSDGQMALGDVAIYDESECWIGADIRISAENNIRPYAYIGAILAEDTAYVIHAGRAWDGSDGDVGPWDEPNGYRTLIHEFAHYALHLYDEYTYYRYDATGAFLGEASAFCTDPENKEPMTDSTNASIMDWQYTTSEFAQRGILWPEACELTRQWQVHGESDWETILRIYEDQSAPARWQFVTPADRGNVMAGPDDIPTVMPDLPVVTAHNPNPGESIRQLTVLGLDGPHQGALVALYKGDEAIDQGNTDENGRIEIYGAAVDDWLRAMAVDGSLYGEVQVKSGIFVTLTMESINSSSHDSRSGLSAQADNNIAYVRIRPLDNPDPNQIDFRITLEQFDEGTVPGIIISEPDSGILHSFTPVYSATNGVHIGELSFQAQQGVGQITAYGSTQNNYVNLQGAYRLQHVFNNEGAELFSHDGRLRAFIDANSLLSNDAHIAILSSPTLPGSIPEDITLASDVYEITTSAIATLARPGGLRFFYDSNLVERPENLGIYWWDPLSGWQPMESTLNKDLQLVTTNFVNLGIYALMEDVGNHLIFLPLVIN